MQPWEPGQRKTCQGPTGEIVSLVGLDNAIIKQTSLIYKFHNWSEYVFNIRIVMF